MGANAWAYDVPSGYEIKTVYLGTDNGDGTVSVEDFESMESLSSAWGSGTLWTNLSSGTLFLDEIVNVAKPSLNEEVNYTMDGETKVYDKPTYVGGKAVVFHNRTNKTSNPYYGTFSFDAVSTGKFVFNGDMYFATSAGPLHVIFVDSDGNTVIDFHWNNGSSTRKFNYEYINNEGNQTTGETSLGYCDYRSYKGFGIKDFVLDLTTGDFEFTLDFINTRTANNIVRNQVKLSGSIQTGRNIAQMRVGTDAAGSSTVNYYTYLDNVSIYTVGVESGSYNYTVKAKAGATELSTLDAGTCKEGQNYIVAGLPLVIKGGDGKFYKLDDDDVTNYKKTFTMGDEDQESVVDYTLDASIVAFTESGTESKGEGNYSNGAVGSVNSGGYNHITDGLSLGSINAGVYKFIANVTGNQGRGLAVRNNAVDNSSNNYAQINSTGVNELEFILPETRTLILTGRYTNGTKTNQSSDFDYVIIKKVSDLPSTEKIVVSDAGYATYVSNYNLDFSAATTKAYKVSVASQGVATLTEVSKVPAKTPVLLYYDGGNGAGEDIAITTDAVSAVTGNDLVAGNGATVATTDGDYTNMILNNVDDKVGFYFANGQTVAANRAYLHIASSLAPDAVSESRSMVIVFANETTGINMVQSEKVIDNSYYNLSGQRVSKPTKGLYILNGKKVIIK